MMVVVVVVVVVVVGEGKRKQREGSKGFICNMNNILPLVPIPMHAIGDWRGNVIGWC